MKNISTHIVLFFLFAVINYSQVDSIIKSPENILSKEDSSLSNIAQKDSSIEGISKTQQNIPIVIFKKDTSLSIPAKAKKGLLENLQSAPKELIESINFWSLLQLFIWLLVGAGLVKLIDKVEKLNFFKNVIPFLPALLPILKIFIWISIFYIIIFWDFNISQGFVWIILLIVFSVFSIAAIPFFKNIIGGFYISLVSPFHVGNNIVINNYKGQVKNITWKSVKILTEDNNIITIPNNIFLTIPVTNISLGDKARLITMEFVFPVSFDSETAGRYLKEAAFSSPYISNYYKPEVFLINTDIVNKLNKYALHVYIIDVKFENNFRSLINNSVLEAVNNHC